VDSIVIEGIRCLCRVGVSPSERAKRQSALIDVRLGLDLRKASRSDDLQDTLDYQALERLLRETAESGEYRLIERLAGSLAEEALARDRRIRSVRVTVRKRPASMPQVREVSVELYRTKKPQ